MFRKKNNFAYSISVVFGVVLVWRGVWYMLDEIDLWLFGGSHFWTAVVGFVLGIIILYIPDKDLKEISKM